MRKPKTTATKRLDSDGLPVVSLEAASNFYGARAAKVRVNAAFTRSDVRQVRNVAEWLAKVADWLDGAQK